LFGARRRSFSERAQKKIEKILKGFFRVCLINLCDKNRTASEPENYKPENGKLREETLSTAIV
jgi:hypothetical protein